MFSAMTPEKVKAMAEERRDAPLMASPATREMYPNRYYATYDEVTRCVTGWYDAWDMSKPELMKLHPHIEVPCDVWESRTLDAHRVIDGVFVNLPPVVEAIPVHQEAAYLLEDAGKYLWTKYGSRGRAVPPEWVAYMDQLDEVVERKTTMLPQRILVDE